jgi:hypothetical protein
LDTLAQGNGTEVGHLVGQLGELLQDLKTGGDDLVNLLAGVADMDARNEAVGNHHAVAADPAEKPSVDLVAAGSIVAVEQDYLGGVVADLGNLVPALNRIMCR